jgi:hypothetical protein
MILYSSKVDKYLMYFFTYLILIEMFLLAPTIFGMSRIYFIRVCASFFKYINPPPSISHNYFIRVYLLVYFSEILLFFDCINAEM